MAVGMVAPFAPSGNGVGVAMPASTASVSATLPASGESVLFFNSTASIAFVRLARSASVSLLPSVCRRRASNTRRYANPRRRAALDGSRPVCVRRVLRARKRFGHRICLAWRWLDLLRCQSNQIRRRPTGRLPLARKRAARAFAATIRTGKSSTTR